MKKIVALMLAVLMAIGCVAAAMADEVLEFVTEGSEGTNSFVEGWAGEYTLEIYFNRELLVKKTFNVY